ncbi:hypothetical protein JK358_11600 [Nocardia sp. 2]|uniref:Uncharacterized protein n=1 Tax=Nocardia acididurans TaxID=2802282 RepID=A0ABS1M7A5_9NOCA|nr:hypothetical protein [Nocardia acididurans]MBL1075038.1 hypothetical protein [Nocardia acididurans]
MTDNDRTATPIRRPAPAPRFTRTPAATPAPMNQRGTDPATILAEWDIDADRFLGKP